MSMAFPFNTIPITFSSQIHPASHPLSSPLCTAPYIRQAPSWQLPASDGAQASVAVEEGVREVGINTYDAALEGAGDKLVVLDLYTQWWVN